MSTMRFTAKRRFARISAGWLAVGGVSLLLAACGGGSSSSSNGGGAAATIASITLSPTTASIAVGATQQFTATAKDSSGNVMTGVTFTWDSSSTSVATITGSGLASGVAAGSTNVTASASGITSTAAALTVTNPSSGSSTSISTAAGSVTLHASEGTFGSAQVVAAPAGVPSGISTPFGWFTFTITGVTPGATVTLTFTVPAGFTLTGYEKCNSGTCSALPGVTVSGSTLTVTLTDGGSGDTDGAANGSITDPGAIIATSSSSNPLAMLSGQYTFLAKGYDSAVAGSVMLDGKGNVTGGAEDIRAPATSLSGSGLGIASGTYTVGSDGRGTLSYQDANGNKFTFAIAVGKVSSGIATAGQMIEFDKNPMEMTGSLALQTPGDFSTSALTGTYAFQTSGWDTTPAPGAMVGSFTAGSGAISSGMYDENAAGSITSASTFTGSIGTIDSNGRGTLTISGPSGSNTLDFYVVSAGKWLLINDISGTGVASGRAVQQTGGPFTASSLSGATILTDRDDDTSCGPDASLALVNFGAAGSVAALHDENDCGVVSLSQTASGTWSLTSASSGRFLLTFAGAHTVVGYLVAPNEAIGISDSSGFMPDTVTLEPQSAGPFSNASLSGAYFVGTLPLLSQGAPGSPPPALSIQSGALNFDGSGGVTATFEDNSSGTVSSDSPDSEGYSVASNGRATLTSGAAVVWIVSPTKAYALQIAPGQPSSPNPFILVIQK